MLTSPEIKLGEADTFVYEEEEIEVRKECGSYGEKEQHLFDS